MHSKQRILRCCNCTKSDFKWHLTYDKLILSILFSLSHTHFFADYFKADQVQLSFIEWICINTFLFNGWTFISPFSNFTVPCPFLSHGLTTGRWLPSSQRNQKKTNLFKRKYSMKYRMKESTTQNLRCTLLQKEIGLKSNRIESSMEVAIHCLCRYH